jgi:RHS repeat-associated protein
MTQEQTPQGVITYAPDDADRRTTMTVAGQPPVSYSWDNANRLGTITRDTLVASYAYDAANRRTQLTLPNGVSIDYGYDAANRLTGLTYSGLRGGPQSLTYAYDPAGNRVRTGGSWARTLLPTAISSATYDAANRQLTLGPKTMTYDLNGNLATLREAGQRRPTPGTPATVSGPGLSASFAYDGFKRRTQKTITGFATTFQSDGLDVINEVNGGQTVNYLRGVQIDETLARLDDSGTICYAPDAIGNTVAVTDSGGNVSTEYTYEPFGRTVPTGAASQNTLQFTGREQDGTGLYYFRARYYDPRLGRFLQEDHVESADIANLCSYVENDPVGRRPSPQRRPGVQLDLVGLVQRGGHPQDDQLSGLQVQVRAAPHGAEDELADGAGMSRIHGRQPPQRLLAVLAEAPVTDAPTPPIERS